MVPCQRCGATLDPSARSCPYCGTVTQYAHALDQQRVHQQWQAEQNAQAHSRAHAEKEIVKQARIGIVTTIVGLVFCCAPVSIAGLILSIRSKTNAQRHGLMAPASSTTGLVLGICATLATVGMWLNFFIFMAQEDQRRADLERRSALLSLNKKTACELVELHLDDEGYKTDVKVESAICHGPFEQRTNQATLEGVDFEADGKRVLVTACLARGQKWEVVELKESGRCGEPPEAAPSASQRVPTAATPSASIRPSVSRSKQR